MLFKLGKDFGITGKLFLHIHSFLSDSVARLKINNVFGQWIESEIGTSAGTSLGPILFIVNVRDVPCSITPKFAVTVTDVYKLVTGIVMRSWQRKWNEESTGRTTFSFIPEVKALKSFFQGEGKLEFRTAEFCCMILC